MQQTEGTTTARRPAKQKKSESKGSAKTNGQSVKNPDSVTHPPVFPKPEPAVDDGRIAFTSNKMCREGTPVDPSLVKAEACMQDVMDLSMIPPATGRPSMSLPPQPDIPGSMPQYPPVSTIAPSDLFMVPQKDHSRSGFG